ncbi:MAG: serine hydrolase [Flavobacteriales bacterium]|nr:serine hydrolase [Flavobacteriales bacterium]MEB2342269.1 serine hydrolase [Flavobacteriia bacterium]
MRRTVLLSLSLVLGLISMGGGPPVTTQGPHAKATPPFLDRPTPWADSVFATLDLDQRIAQLMMVAAYSNKDEKHYAEIEELIRRYNLGGLIFFQGGPLRQAALTNRYQAAARTPLLIGMDLEWGLAMRLDSTVRYPFQMTLGAAADDEGPERMGAEIARQMRRLGVQVSFSPDVDVNVNAANPVINHRSFGEDPELVARKGIAYMKGLQQGGIIATAKHFPGHGDTNKDSHKTLPLVDASRERLDSVELLPFRRLIDAGVSAIMVAHLEVPALDSTPARPSTMSPAIVTTLLQEKMGFRGLVFTDALNMKGIADAAKPGEIELKALMAGNDVLLFPQDPVKAMVHIRQAVDSGLVTRERIDESCLKILRAKEWAGLDHLRPVRTEGLHEGLNAPQATTLRRELYGHSLTVARNNGVLPIQGLDTLRIASLVIGDQVHNGFQQALGRYAPMAEFRCDKVLNPAQAQALLDSLKQFNLVIASVHNTSFRVDKEFGVPQITLDFLRRLADQQRMVFVLFANPYRLALAYGAQRWDAVVVAYEENADTRDLAAQLLFGALPATARLPVTASAYFKAGQGEQLPAIGRLRYGPPEEEAMDRARLQRIDTLVREGLKAEAFPGCQVLVARNGMVVWDKAYGSPTYAGDRPVVPDDIYDLASITKVAATTLALMKLVDEGRLDVEQTLGHYLPELEGQHPRHASLKISEILAHQAGFKPFVPFYLRLSAKKQLKPGVMAPVPDEGHDMRVAEGFYIHHSYRDSLVQWVLDAPLGERGKYVYSDMGMYLLMRVVERVSGQPFEEFLKRNFYAPLGLSTMGFNPLDRFPIERIMPTENDTLFRRELVRGTVHDPGAAMMGGVAGHAGLFSDANDLAILMQMLLNGGTYGGHRYLTEKTIARFTACRYCTGDPRKDNRRGLGWDRPQAPGTPGPASDSASSASFGHTGFTGTMVWADPANGTIYVFLSNRVYPDADNKRLQRMNIRTDIQTVVEKAATVPQETVVPGGMRN